MKKLTSIFIAIFLVLLPLHIMAIEIELDQLDQIHVKKDETVDLDFVVEDADLDLSAINWTNSNDQIAIVKQDGNNWQVEGLNYGSAALNGYIDGSLRIQILVQVYDSIVFLNPSHQIDIGESIQSNLVFQPAAVLEDFTPTYASSDVEIASVNEAGVITGHQVGKVTITAHYLDSIATKEVEVIDRPDFVFEYNNISLNVDSSVNIPYRLSLFGDVDKTITWSSQNEQIASIDQLGNVYGHAQGSTNVSAFVNGNEYLLSVEVIKSIERIDIEPKEVVLNIDEVFNLEVEITPVQYADTPITWSSSKPSVASVVNGQIRANSVGEATISAKIDHLEQHIQVRVNEPLIGLTINPSRLTLQQGGRYHLRVLPLPSTSNEPLELVYTTSDANIVSVDPYGNVTAHNQGHAYVFVSHKDFNASVDVNVVFAQDSDGQKRMIGSPNSQQIVTFDLRGLDSVSEFVLEIPQVTRLNSIGQNEVAVNLDSRVYENHQLLVNSLVLSPWYRDKDVHLTVFGPEGNRLFEYTLINFQEVNKNLFPTSSLIQSNFSNFKDHLVEVNVPINLKSADVLNLYTRVPLLEDSRFYENNNGNLRLVSTSSEVMTSSLLRLSGLKAQTIYLTDQPLESRIAPFLLILIGIVSLFTSFFLLKRYNEQSIQQEKQERSRHESINYQQKFREEETR